MYSHGWELLHQSFVVLEIPLLECKNFEQKWKKNYQSSTFLEWVIYEIISNLTGQLGQAGDVRVLSHCPEKTRSEKMGNRGEKGGASYQDALWGIHRNIVCPSSYWQLAHPQARKHCLPEWRNSPAHPPTANRGWNQKAIPLYRNPTLVRWRGDPSLKQYKQM